MPIQIDPDTGGVEGAGPYGPPTAVIAEKDWQSIADAMGISVKTLKQRVTSYQAQHAGVSQADALRALYNRSLAEVQSATPGETGSGSGSSGGTGAFGSVSTGQAKANAVAGYANILTGWGIKITPEVSAFINRAVSSNMNSSSFLAALRKTAFYAKAFPGIMKPNGTMRMSEAQYISGFNSARDYAASVGRPLSLQAYGLAIKNGNSPTEIKQKIEALDILKSDQGTFSEFNEYLRARGVINKKLTKPQLLEFIMGLGPKKFEEEWQTAYTAARIENAGLEVGRPKKGGEIAYKELSKLINHAEAMGTVPTSADYATLAANLQSMDDWSVYDNGITRKDMIRLFFGGKQAPEIARRIKLAMETSEAFETEERAVPNYSSGPQGLQAYGRTPQQASE